MNLDKKGRIDAQVLAIAAVKGGEGSRNRHQSARCIGTDLGRRER